MPIPSRAQNVPNASASAQVPTITIIVAAYNRGSVLARALRTVIAQTETDWQALVIGDACTDDTAEQIAALADPRIKFINLPERFGEQAGPNSVGMALSASPLVAFLNQDDYWLPNHLAAAVAGLASSGADLFWSRAAFFSNRGASDHRAFFVETSPSIFKLEDIYTHPWYNAEPLSKWVITKDALNRLGAMRLAGEIALLPISDFCQRAFRIGLKLATGQEITVLKDRFWAPPPSYDNLATYAEQWVRQIEAGQTSELTETIAEETWLAEALGMNRAFIPNIRPAGQDHPAVIDRETGLDLVALQAAARERSTVLLEQLLEERTGKTLRTQPRLEEMIAFAKGAMQ